jgi:hypothetical protein
MELSELRCKNCGAPIENEEIYLDLAMAKCSHCGTIFSLKGLPARESADAGQSDQRMLVPTPKRIKVLNQGETLQITYRWFGPKFIFMIFFTVFWNGFMLTWHGLSLRTGMWPMSLFGLLHTAVGIGMAYYTLAGLLNQTTVQVKGGELTIRHAPLPWWGNKRIQALDIEQIYSREKVSRSKQGSVNYTYEVHAILDNSTKEKLVGGLKDQELALYIEQTLEKYLGIHDRPVRGEIPR